MEKSKLKKESKMNILFVAYWLIVIVGKVIRYTVLKDSLVNMSIGHGWLPRLSSGGNSFLFNVTGDSVASENSIALFQIFRIFGLTSYIDYEFIITIIWNILFFAILLTLKKKVSVFHMCFLMMSVAVLNIWDFCLSKEPLQMIFFIIIYFILISKFGDKQKFIFCILIILLSCFVFRNYYILIVAFSVFAYLLIDKYIIKEVKINKTDIIKIIIAFAILYVTVILFSRYFSQKTYNYLMYFNQRETAAKTDLSGIFHSSNLFIISIDYILLVVRMLFPLELIKLGPQYWLYILYQMMISSIILNSIRNIKKMSSAQRNATYIFIGFLFASATFEPDFGSWIRHEAVAIPILIAMTGMQNEKTNILIDINIKQEKTN